MATERKNKGRQKIEMKKMTKQGSLHVTFSKRRAGLFNKASELCTLCGAKVATIVFSPGEKAFSFGHPSVEEVIDRFLLRNSPYVQTHSDSMSGKTSSVVQGHSCTIICDLNLELTQVNTELEAAKKRGEALKQTRKANQTQNWWEGPIETLQLDQIDQLRESMLALNINVKKEVEKLLKVETSNNNPLFAGVGNTSNAGGDDCHTTNNNGGFM